jgi:hypothetical protein
MTFWLVAAIENNHYPADQVIRKHLLLLMASVGLTLNVHARIGWTLHECIAKYGPETSHFETEADGSYLHFFRVGDLLIGATMRNNLVVAISYSHVLVFEPRISLGAPLSSIEMEVLKNKNLPHGAAWGVDAFNSRGQRVISAHKNGLPVLLGLYDSDLRSLTIGTVAYLNLRIKIQQSSTEEKLKGL